QMEQNASREHSADACILHPVKWDTEGCKSLRLPSLFEKSLVLACFTFICLHDLWGSGGRQAVRRANHEPVHYILD
ncbi:MAG: hypothetical protein ACE5DY_08740, partial [Mariprofundaceae bacterium]